MGTTSIEILKSLHGRVCGLDKDDRLIVPSGILSGTGLTAGAGITGGTGTVYRSTRFQQDGIIKTQIYIDLTGLASSTTDLDIIGVGTSAAYIGQVTAALCGQVFAGSMTCLEVPVGGADDMDLYAATEGTGVFDGIVTDLAETALLTKGGAWGLGLRTLLTALPIANKYLYLTGGEAGTAAAYTAGQFLIELEGYAIQS